MTTHSSAGTSIESIHSSSDRTPDNDSEGEAGDEHQPESTLTPQLEALADVWDALQSLPAREDSPTNYLETAETRSKLESQFEDRLTQLGADLFEKFLSVRESEESSAKNLQSLTEIDATLAEELEEHRGDGDELQSLVPELYEAVTDTPEGFEESGQIQREVSALEELLGKRRLQAFASLPEDLHRAMLTVVVSRMRHVQTYRSDEIVGEFGLDEHLSELFRRLGRHLNRHDPGYIRGMKLEHDPYTDSWVSDVKHWSERLEDLCNDYLTTPLGEAEAGGKPESPTAPESLDAHRALNSIEASIDDETRDRDDLRDLVAMYLDRGLSARHPRLVSLLAPHSELFTAERFQPLQHAFSAVE